MMNTVTCSSVAVSRGRRLEKRITPSGARRAPTTITSPSTSRALAKIEPMIAVWATTSLALLQREDHDEQLGQVAERRLEHPGDAGAEALAELLGRERDHPGEPRQREGRQREAWDRRPLPVVGDPRERRQSGHGRQQGALELRQARHQDRARAGAPSPEMNGLSRSISAI